MDELGGGHCAKGILPPWQACLMHEIFVEGIESVLPGLSHLVRLCLSIQFQTIVGEGVGKEEGGRGEGHKPIVCDWQAGTFCFFLRLLHRHDILRDAGVAGPVDGEVADEGDGVSYFEAPNFFGEMGEECEW